MKLYDFKFLFTQKYEHFSPNHLLPQMEVLSRSLLLHYLYLFKMYSLVFKNLMSRQNSDRVYDTKYITSSISSLR